jgi:hypothetical protein
MNANRTAVEATLKQLGVDAAASVRAQLCLTLADQLDQAGSIPVNVAAVAKELRMSITELERSAGDFNDELSDFLADLSTPVRHAEES